MNAVEQNPSLRDMSVQQRAEFAPKQYFGVIANDDVSSTMQPGLIFTADNLRVIKRYVDYVYRLPKDIDEITQGHDYSLLGIDPALFESHYKSLRKHADAWVVLERETKQLGGQLEHFADQFIQQGDLLVSALKKLDGYGRLSQRLSGVVDEVTLTRTTFQPLGREDRKQIVTLGSYLELIREDIAEVKLEIASIRGRASWFAEAVVKQLRPEVDGLMLRIKSVDVAKRINELRQQIAVLDVDIEQRNGEYQALVGYAFTGLLFGPIGVAITGGVFGSKAEEVRRAKNELIARRSGFAEAVAAINPMIGDLERTASQIADLKFRLTDVQTAAQNLEDVWGLLEVYAQESEEELGRIQTDIELARFIQRFDRVVRPWVRIRGLSVQLSRIFNTAIDEIRKEGVSR